MAADPTPAPGTRVGRYELLKQIATSAMGSTWIARSTDPDKKRVAVGVMQKSLTSFSVAEAVLREARLAQKLRHENVLDVVETVVGDGQLSVVSAYVDGAWLVELLSEPLPAPVALRVTLDVVAAVAAAHAQTPALSHGDLNPGHVRVGLDGIGRVSSFGVARAVTGIVPAEERGKSLAYLAPERLDIDGSGKVTLSTRGTMEAGARKASDVYAAAAIAWHALSGTAPFVGDSDREVAEGVRDRSPAEPDDVGDLEGVFDVLRKALAKQKQERPSIEDLQKQLKAAADAAGGAADRDTVTSALTARGIEPQQVEEPPPQPAKSAAPPAKSAAPPTTKSVEPKADEKKPDSEKKPEEKKDEKKDEKKADEKTPPPPKANLRKGTLIGMQAPLGAAKPVPPEPPKPKSPEPPKADEKKEAKPPPPPVKPPMPRPGMKKTLVGMQAPPPPDKPRAPIESLQDFEPEEDKVEAKVDVDVDVPDEPKDDAGAVAPWDEPAADGAEAKSDDAAEAKTDEPAAAKKDDAKADAAASPKPAAAAGAKKQDMDEIFAADAAAPESPLPAEVPGPIGSDDDDVAAMRPKKKTGMIVGGVVVGAVALIGILAITSGGDNKDAKASATPTASQAKPPAPAKTGDQPATPPTATDMPVQDPPKPEATTPAPPETAAPAPEPPKPIAIAKGPAAQPQRVVSQPPKPPPIAKPPVVVPPKPGTAKPVGTVKKPPPKKANPNTL